MQAQHKPDLKKKKQIKKEFAIKLTLTGIFNGS